MTDSATDGYVERLQQERAEKDDFFGNHPRSPVPAAERDDFEGLRYFEPDPALRFETPVDRFDDPDQITVETTRDGQQTYHDVGVFTVRVDGESVTLHAFQSPDDENRLWVPFRDATSGTETYPAGRYLDLETPEDRAGDDWVLDFNTAYNPFCAYADAYDCPLVPRDNWLDIGIRAGEKVPL